MTDIRKPRSIDQHKRFFALVAAAFHHWPHDHAFQPENAEHLRAWLLVKAKHCVIQTFHMSDDATEFATLIPIVTSIMFRRYSWAKNDGKALHVCVPQTIAMHGPDAIGHNQMTSVCADVDAVLLAEGLDPEELLKETEAAA